tara:strand:- start:13472 stop:14080 length:609 start_codon:yes stop_codon:yes gene_type:complete
MCDEKWTCDTIEVWIKGNHYSIEETLDMFKENNYTERLKQGAHLIITGGEPLLQQHNIVEFLKQYKERFSYLPYIEIETNCTQYAGDELCKYVDLFNVSPKLSSAGMNIKRRYKPQAIERFNEIENSIFKFVIANKDDWEELKSMYIDSMNIKTEKIWLMPAADDQDMLRENSEYVSKLCINHCYNYSSRLQIELWNQTTGV